MKGFRIVLIAPLLSAVVPTAAQNPVRDFALTGANAVGLLAAHAVAGPGVQSMAWSSDGRFLVCVCEGGPGDLNLGGKTLSAADLKGTQDRDTVTLELYDTQSGQTTEVWSAAKSEWRLAPPQWLQGYDAAFVVANHFPLVGKGGAGTVPTGEKRLIEVAAEEHSSETSVSLPYRNAEPVMQVFPSPTKAEAVLCVVNHAADVGANSATFYLLGVNQEPPLHPDLSLASGGIQWSTDGSVPYASQAASPGSDQNSRPVCYALLFDQGRVAPEPNPALTPAAVSKSSVSLDPRESTWSRALWLSVDGGAEEIPVSADCQQEALAPGGQAVAFVTEGIAMVRPVIRMPAKEYLAMREPFEKEATEEKGRRIYQVVRRYAADHGDQAPASSSDWTSALSPYALNPDDLEGVDYRFAGGALGALPNADQVLLAVLQTATGRGYLFADGTVTWEAQLPQ